jgi:thymidylate synthase
MRSDFTGLPELYPSALRLCCYDYEFENSPRGQRETEVLGFAARLADPTRRYLGDPRRQQNVVFNYAEALWYLSGRNDLAFIECYAPSMRRYSPDGVTLPGTGYGAKLRHFGTGDLDQIERALDVLTRDDRDSKRVVLQIFDADEDVYKRNIDVSCTLGLQCMLRDGALHMAAFMRANDAFIGLLNDIFSFTFIQEYLARRLGVAVGGYTHHVGSLHVYAQNQQSARALAGEPAAEPGGLTPPRMPQEACRGSVETVLDYEARIRAGQVSEAQLEAIELAPYWLDILRLFWIYRQIADDRAIEPAVVQRLHPTHRALLGHRWPGRIG